MYILGAFICTIIAAFTYIYDRKFYNPIFVFSVVWGLIIFFSGLQLFGLYGVSDDTLLIFLTGIIAFTFGGFVSVSIKRRLSIGGKIQPLTDSEEIFNYKIMTVMAMIVLFYMSVNAIQVFLLKQTGLTTFDIRSAMQGYSDVDYYKNLMILRSTDLLEIIYTWIILPCYHTLVLMCCVDMVIGNKNKKLLSLTLINVILKVYAEGTRITLFYVAIYIILLFIIFNKNGELSKSAKKKIRIGLVAVIIGLVVVSNIRLETMEKTLAEEIYLYFCTCVPFFDKMLNTMEHGEMLSYGATSLYGIIQIPVVILRKLGFPCLWYSKAATLISNTEVFYQIRTAAYSTRGNAYATMFYYFICDFGYVGVILGSLLFGFICMIPYKSIRRQLACDNISLRTICVFLVFMQSIIMSFVRFSFARVDFAYMLIFIYIFIKKTPKNAKRS